MLGAGVGEVTTEETESDTTSFLSAGPCSVG